jgi:hypothetical protein
MLLVFDPKEWKKRKGEVPGVKNNEKVTGQKVGYLIQAFL